MSVDRGIRLRGAASLHLERSSQQRFNYLLAKHNTGRHRTQTLRRGLVTARNSLSLDESFAAQLFQVVRGVARPILGLALPALCANLGSELRSGESLRCQRQAHHSFDHPSHPSLIEIDPAYTAAPYH